MKTTNNNPLITLLTDILEKFPQADPESEFYNEGIDGCEAVNYISELVPDIRETLEKDQLRENNTLSALKAAWDFIENVTDDDPERSDKFFALREKVRNVLWAEHREGIVPNVAIVMKGGLVECVVSDHPNLLPDMNLMLIDYDTDGADDEELLQVPQGDETTVDAVVRCESITKAAIELTAVKEQLEW